MIRPSKSIAQIELRKHHAGLSNAYGLGAHCIGELRALLIGMERTARASGDTVTAGLAKVAVHLADSFENDLDVNREEADINHKALGEENHG